MIRDAIKQQTTRAHKDTENVSFSQEILDGSISLEQYKQLINNHAVLNGEWERSWDTLPFEPVLAWELDKRRKQALLDWDCHHLGIEPKSSYHPQFLSETPAEFLGTLYVFEGSTLGGSVIHKHLRKNNTLSEVEDFKFYKGYAESTGPMWKQFIASLEKLTEQEEIDSAIKSAQHAFGEVARVFTSASANAR